MTISHVYNKVTETMKVIENVNFIEYKSLKGRLENQKKVNKVYKMLDDFKAELERENIRKKQKRGGEQRCLKH